MKKIFLSLALAALMPICAVAQDARQRTTATIVADALDQLPAQYQSNYNTIMQELASTGAEGVMELAAMLVPAEKGKNSSIEYALYGLTAYVSGPNKDKERAEVRKGLALAIDKCTDNPNKAFLMTLLTTCATADDAPVFVKYVNHDYLADWAVNGLAHTPDTDKAIIDLMNANNANKPLLAYAAGVKNLTDAEPILLGWIDGANEKTLRAIYQTLGKCGSESTIATLGKAAKAAGYEWEETDITASYLALLQKWANQHSTVALKEAKSLLKATKKSHIRGAALQAIVTIEGSKAQKTVLNALKDANRDYRVNALRLSESFANDAWHATLAKQLKGKGTKTVKADIINWFGTNHVSSQIDAIVANFASTNDEIAGAAIAAASKIGGETALNALVAQLNGNHADKAHKALLSFNGKIDNAVVKALVADKTTQLAALKLASTRSIDAASDKVFALLNAPDSEISAAAYNALAGVVSPKDFGRLSQLIEKDGGKHTANIQSALENSLQSLPKDKQFATVKPFIAQSAQPSLYYPVLAQVGNSEAIAEIMKGYKGNFKSEAFNALLKVDNQEMIGQLYNIALTDKANSQAALDKYTTLVDKSGKIAEHRYLLYRQALELATDAALQNRLIKLIGDTHLYQAFLVVDHYLDNAATSAAAAEAVRTIASKNAGKFGGEPLRKSLEKAIKVFEGIGNADAGYAIDDIKNMLKKLPTEAYLPLAGANNWSVVALNPAQKASTKAKQAKAAQDLAQDAAKAWNATELGMAYSGNGVVTMGSAKEYENFELIFDWKCNGKAAIGLRSIPQIDLGGEMSGAITSNLKAANTPSQKAVKPVGDWNTAYVKVVNDRVTVVINGVETTTNVILENACDRNLPAYVKGQILLISQGAPVEFRDINVRQLPETPKFVLSKEEQKEGFEVLFDGTSMHKWTGNTTDYVPVDGAINVTAQYGGSGNLYTVDEYSDFIFRFEFAYLREGVNNGVGIRTPMGVDAAYEGMEIQVLDHDAEIYKNLREYQQHGSVYGIIPAKRVKFPALGTWNTEEIRAVGDRITVTVNGEVILDGNIREACQGHNIAPDGAKSNPYTVDKQNHPGLFNKSGHIGFLGHGSGVKFRNIRIKDLSK